VPLAQFVQHLLAFATFSGRPALLRELPRRAEAAARPDSASTAPH
jgi:hypothetical protein